MRAIIGLAGLIVWLLKRVLIRLYRYLIPEPQTAGEKAFIEENSSFWSGYSKPQQDELEPRYVLVEQSDNIGLLCNASMAAIISHAKSLKPLFVITSSQDRSVKRLLKSYYPDGTFVPLNTLRYAVAWIPARLQAAKVFHALKSPGDILNLRVDGIKYGDLIYDAVLSKGYATIREIDGKVLSAIYVFFWYRYLIKDIIRRYKIDKAVLSHTIGIPSGTSSRYLLQSGIEVINRSGSYQLQLKKYQSTDDIGVYPLRPEPRYFSFLVNRRDDTMLRLADKYLRDRFDQNIKDVGVDLAFDHRKRTYGNKEEFCSRFGLEPDRKIAFVMLHAFNDQPHSHFAKPMIFRDYYDWFEKTLEIAKSVSSVNWVFKEHPAADLYITKDLSLDAMFEGVRHPHIKFLNRHADINSRSLRHVADTIITCMGTAGLEFSCFGIPCVLAGESTYSGYGFTVEPGDAKEYEEQLRHIDNLQRLNESQIRIAKIITFFEYSMMQGTRYLFCPFYDDYRKIITIKGDELWQDAAKLMKNGNKAEMRRQVSITSDFIRNPSYTQFVNLEKYDFMREVVREVVNGS